MTRLGDPFLGSRVHTGGMSRVAVAALAAAAAVVLSAAPAHAGGSERVEGTAIPDSAPISFAHVACDDLFAPGGGPVDARVGPGPGTAPLGSRSLGFSVDAGSALAAAYPVDSVLQPGPVSLDAWSASPARGVAFAVYRGADRLWVGRAPLALDGGGWQTFSATDRDYTWDDGTTASVADLAAAHGGDGGGVFALGFGCDGTPFRIDALRSGGTTLDLEGISTSLTIDADGPRLSGRLTTGTGESIPNATVLLESRSGNGGWEPVAAVPVQDGRVAYEVDPAADPTDYRWRFVDRPLAQASVSDVVTVRGTPAESPSMSPEPSPGL